MVTPLRSCMAVSHFANVPREVVNYHLIIVLKVGFYGLWISGVIEMMTPLNLFCFGDGGPIWTPIEKLIQLCFLVQGVSKLSTPFKERGKMLLPLSPIFHKSLSQTATVVYGCGVAINDDIKRYFLHSP